MSVMSLPLKRRLVIFEKAKTVLLCFLAVWSVSRIWVFGVSGVPLVSEPSKRIRLLFSVFVSVVWSHFSRMFAMRFGIC